MAKRARLRLLPAPEWDGLVSVGPKHRLPPNFVRDVCQNRIEVMEHHPGLQWLRDEDDEANATPVGGMQYKYRGQK